jgi:hypothetical protein
MSEGEFEFEPVPPGSQPIAAPQPLSAGLLAGSVVFGEGATADVSVTVPSGGGSEQFDLYGASDDPHPSTDTTELASSALPPPAGELAGSGAYTSGRPYTVQVTYFDGTVDQLYTATVAGSDVVTGETVPVTLKLAAYCTVNFRATGTANITLTFVPHLSGATQFQLYAAQNNADPSGTTNALTTITAYPAGGLMVGSLGYAVLQTMTVQLVITVATGTRTWTGTIGSASVTSGNGVTAVMTEA